MNQIIIVCLSFLMMICVNSNNVTEYQENKDEVSNYNSTVGVPIHEVLARAGYLTIDDYEEEYKSEPHDWGMNDDPTEGIPLGGVSYIKSDNTLWDYVIGSYEENKTIKHETLGSDVISIDVVSINAFRNVIMKLKTDRSLWIKGVENLDKNITDEYGFSKVAEDIIMAVSVDRFKRVYGLKKDNTLWQIFYDNAPVKILDDISYISTNHTFPKEYSIVIKTDGSLWQCKGDNFNELEKVTDNAIYTDSYWSYAFVLKKDKSLYFWNCGNSSKKLIKIDDNVEYAKIANQLTTLKTDGSLWYYYFDHETLDKNTILKSKLADNVQVLLRPSLFKDKDNKLVRIHGKNGDPAQATLEVIEGYDIKTPELYDITKPFE